MALLTDPVAVQPGCLWVQIHLRTPSQGQVTPAVERRRTRQAGSPGVSVQVPVFPLVRYVSWAKF